MSNRLIDQTSPYLQQHAQNPVDWYPWGEEALHRARSENKPILLSIGYSACHWCHVMEHESFEDETIAAIMNEHFINIKVDREERPDLDKIYQFSYQLLNQRGGGWPLNMFLTPVDQTPFFGGTYFPPEPRHNMPAFSEILRRVSDFFYEHPEDLQKQNTSIQEYLQRASEGSVSANDVESVILDEARRQLEKSFDVQYAGFGAAPKFPHPTNIERLMRHWSSTGRTDEKALNMAQETLRRMALGGIYDQLGGGFCRYSVDEKWMIPHFEKMLYDNGPLLALYADAYSATREKLFKQVAEQTGQWVIREMQSPEGGYYSALDADSEGEEGKFYTWKLSEVQQQLNDEEYAVVTRHYGLDITANFEGDWHFYVNRSVEDIASELHLDVKVVVDHLTSARNKLFYVRESRVRPGRDEKILTAWNGLMIKGMAVAGRRLKNPEFIRSAEQALFFVRDSLWVDGRLLVASKDGKAHLTAYLDDYVFLADSVLSLLEVRWNDEDFHFLLELIEVVLSHFSAENGGFYFTADDHEKLIQRPRPWMDESTPSGNAIAAQVLLRMGYLLGEQRYLDAVERTLKSGWQDIQGFPQAHSALLNALEEHLYPTEIVVLRGSIQALSEWSDVLSMDYAPRRLILTIPDDAVDLANGLDKYEVPKMGVSAYVCREQTCHPPLSELVELQNFLKGGVSDAAT